MSVAITPTLDIGLVDDFYRHTRRWMRYRRELAGFLIDVLCVLVSERATGRLSIDLTQGCAASAEFVERADIDDAH